MHHHTLKCVVCVRNYQHQKVKTEMEKSRNNWRKPVPTRQCPSCGKTLKQRSRTNYPFGRMAGARRTKFYKCTNCNQTLGNIVPLARKLI